LFVLRQKRAMARNESKVPTAWKLPANRRRAEERRPGTTFFRYLVQRFGWLVLPALLLAAWAVCTDAVAGEPYRGPLIDAHNHFGGSFDPETMVRAMRANGVRAMVVMARNYPGPAGKADLPGTDKMALDLAAKFPGRFIPLVGMQRPMLTDADWSNPGHAVNALLKDTEKKLASGRFRGIGELIVRHFAYSRGRHAELNKPIYSAFTRAISRLALRFNVPVVVHMEGDPALVKDFERLIGDYPKVIYVWAHNCGRSRAPVIRRVLAEHPNLMCDLSGMMNFGKRTYGAGWPRMESYTALMEVGGRFLPQMQAIYENFSDRFMIGTDIAHAPVMNDAIYGGRIQRFRTLLGTLNPDTAKQLAETNAVRIFHLDR
jgi:Amidohydrolase